MRYVVIGQSVTAIKLIEQIRTGDQEADVRVVAFDESLPAFPERFFEWLARQLQRADVVYQNENFYRNLRVEFIADKKISRINFNRKTITFDDKSQLKADVIIIADAEKRRFPEIKGTNKIGVFTLHNYAQARELLNTVNRIDTIVIETETLSGILFAQALAAQDKEVIMCIPSEHVCIDLLDEGTSDLMITLLEQQGVRIIRGGTVREVLGEQDVKAVRLNINKVIAAEVVIFPDTLPDLRLYEKGGISVQDRIIVDENLRTSHEGVFAVDEMACGFLPWGDHSGDFRQEQVERILCGLQKKGPLENPENFGLSTRFEISGHIVTVVGTLAVPEGRIFSKSDEQGNLEQRIVLENNVVQGVVLIDNEGKLDQWKTLIVNAQEIDPATHELCAGCVLEEAKKEGTGPDETQECCSIEQSDRENDEITPDSNKIQAENQL